MASVLVLVNQPSRSFVAKGSVIDAVNDFALNGVTMKGSVVDKSMNEGLINTSSAAVISIQSIVSLI